MKKCTFCGTENADENVFCELCGHRFEAWPDVETTAFQNQPKQETHNVNENGYVPTETVAPPKKEAASSNSAVNAEAKDCPFCNGSGKADYLVQSGFKTMLEECPCHICAGTGKLDTEAFSVVSKQLNELREQAVASGKIRDNCPTCRGYGCAFTRNKVFGATAIAQINCPSCTGRKITYPKKG